MEINECEGSYCVCLNVDLIERQAAEIESLKRDCEEKDDLSDQLLATSVRLRAALVGAVDAIRVWHNMGVSQQQRSNLWDIYWRSAPEMKPIREALAHEVKGNEP